MCPRKRDSKFLLSPATFLVNSDHSFPSFCNLFWMLMGDIEGQKERTPLLGRLARAKQWTYIIIQETH